MEDFQQTYERLNVAQKQAVDELYGPVLVIAGPGTGKTQLLSARVAQILRTTDALPQNILCLTFTENGAANMRERLTRFIGSAAYDVQIGTYHSFGSDLIRRFPEYFTETRLERPIDELGKRQILSTIIDKLAYTDPLKQTRWHLGDLMSTISEVKRGILQATDLRAIANSNQSIIIKTTSQISACMVPFAKRMSSKLSVAEPVFTNILAILKSAKNTDSSLHPSLQHLSDLAADGLDQALQSAIEDNSTKSLTKWKNNWLEKDAENNYILSGGLASKRIASLANVLEAYQAALEARGLYDFDDMILRSIEALQLQPELRYTLQEQYQFILLDEFQDTNAAQLRLVKLLSDNPVHEGRPNILAVGDDDQAIYAFQGAQYSNMLDFKESYRSVLLINLSENFRSNAEILVTAGNIAEQITDSLAAAIPGLTKKLVVAESRQTKHVTDTQLEHVEYLSDVAERAGVAERIAKLVANGVPPSQISVLAPKHKYLETLVPYLQVNHNLEVSYERRENILDTASIRQLLTMSQLILALHDRNQQLADSLWPEVLSYSFWGYSVADIWRVSWQANDAREPWIMLLLDSALFHDCALLFLVLASQAMFEPLEVILDRLIGTEEVQTGETIQPSVRSPFRAYYVGPEVEPDSLYQTVTELSVLRSRLREHELQRGEQLYLKDLLNFVQQYTEAEQQLLNTSPYNQSVESIQLMTVFKAKGLEFEHVFVLHAQDNVWGSSASSNNNKLTLPPNLAPIRHAGSSEDERLRTFFVALTRAKSGLHLTSHRHSYTGKIQPRLKYLSEVEQSEGIVYSDVLPGSSKIVIQDGSEAPSLISLEHDWRTAHVSSVTSLQSLLQDRLMSYRLSPTHLTSFIDLEHAGPQSFLLQTLLRFPTASSIDVSFGNAMHATMEWIQQQVNKKEIVPTPIAVQQRFSEFLTREALFGEQYALQEARGHLAIAGYMTNQSTSFTPGNKPEFNFRYEGVVIDNTVRLSGKIDLLEINESTKQITIVDYKTGALGNNPTKLHRYEMQLYFYKLLVEGSHTFANYQVKQGKLIFVEPDANSGSVVSKLINFDDVESDRVRRLAIAVWEHIMNVSMPNISTYGTTLAEIKRFESDLLK